MREATQPSDQGAFPFLNPACGSLGHLWASTPSRLDVACIIWEGNASVSHLLKPLRISQHCVHIADRLVNSLLEL